MTNQSYDIVDTAIASGSFRTLVAAVTATGLTDTLKGTGAFTVFAPSDAAFAKLPAETVENLVKPENKAKLANILKLHVTAGAIMTKDFAGKKLTPKSVQGEDLRVDGIDGVTVSGSKVTSADIACSSRVSNRGLSRNVDDDGRDTSTTIYISALPSE